MVISSLDGIHTSLDIGFRTQMKNVVSIAFNSTKVFKNIVIEASSGDNSNAGDCKENECLGKHFRLKGKV